MNLPPLAPPIRVVYDRPVMKRWALALTLFLGFQGLALANPDSTRTSAVESPRERRTLIVEYIFQISEGLSIERTFEADLDQIQSDGSSINLMLATLDGKEDRFAAHASKFVPPDRTMDGTSAGTVASFRQDLETLYEQGSVLVLRSIEIPGPEIELDEMGEAKIGDYHWTPRGRGVMELRRSFEIMKKKKIPSEFKEIHP